MTILSLKIQTGGERAHIIVVGFEILPRFFIAAGVRNMVLPTDQHEVGDPVERVVHALLAYVGRYERRNQRRVERRRRARRRAASHNSKQRDALRERCRC